MPALRARLRVKFQSRLRPLATHPTLAASRQCTATRRNRWVGKYLASSCRFSGILYQEGKLASGATDNAVGCLAKTPSERSRMVHDFEVRLFDLAKRVELGELQEHQDQRQAPHKDRASMASSMPSVRTRCRPCSFGKAR